MKGKQWVSRAVRRVRVAYPDVYFAPVSSESQECFSEILTWGLYERVTLALRQGLCGRGRRQRGSLWGCIGLIP